jgi:hypothetical protein
MIWMKKNLKTWWKYFDFCIDLYINMLYNIIEIRNHTQNTFKDEKKMKRNEYNVIIFEDFKRAIEYADTIETEKR